MNKNNALIILTLAGAAIFQAGLAPHFGILGGQWFEWINFVTAAVVIITIFERRRNNFAWAAAIFGGFFLDIYSQRFFGFWMILLLFAVAIIKFAVKKYVRIPSYW